MTESSPWRESAASAAGTVTEGPWSPPMQSMAMVVAMAGKKGRRFALGPTACPIGRNYSPLPFQDLFAAVETRQADVVTQMRLASRQLDGQRRVGQKVMGTVHATLRRGISCSVEQPQKL